MALGDINGTEECLELEQWPKLSIQKITSKTAVCSM